MCSGIVAFMWSAVVGKSVWGPIGVGRGGTASMRTQLSMLAVFLLAGGAAVIITAPRALIRYGTLAELCSSRGRRNVGVGRRGSGRHGEGLALVEGWERFNSRRCSEVSLKSLMPVW